MNIQPITGITSVDFKIKADGFGAINMNGSPTLNLADKTKTINNHQLPKLRGFSPFTGVIKESGYKVRKTVEEIDLKETPLYVSANCIRHHLFKDQKFDKLVNKNNTSDFLATLSGLVQGYVVASEQWYKTSALFISDFVDQLCKGNYEQFSTSGERDSNSIFSATTVGETEYLAHGSISIEELQFISTDNKFGRAAIATTEKEAIETAQKIEDFLQSLSPSSLSPKAQYHENYVRKNGGIPDGQAGILLNDDALTILVQVILYKIENLVISQHKGYLTVSEITVDYNSTGRAFQMKHNSKHEITNNKEEPFAVYYEAIEDTAKVTKAKKK